MYLALPNERTLGFAAVNGSRLRRADDQPTGSLRLVDKLNDEWNIRPLLQTDRQRSLLGMKLSIGVEGDDQRNMTIERLLERLGAFDFGLVEIGNRFLVERRAEKRQRVVDAIDVRRQRL